MKTLSRSIGLALLLVSLLRLSAESPGRGDQPPLIDREIFFGNPEISGAQLSPDGKSLAFLRPWKDTQNIWVKRTGEPFASARRLTAETKRPVAAYFWSFDNRNILYVKDHDGDENYNLFAVDPEGAPMPADGLPTSRDLTGLKGVRVALYSLPKHEPDLVYVGLNDRDKAWHDLYRVSISTGARTLLRQNTERISGWIFDQQGRLRLATRTADNGDTEILRVDPDKFTKIYSCSIFESCGPIRFEKEGKRIYLSTNHGENVNLISLVLLDPETGRTEPVESDPKNRVDFGFAVFSEATDELVGTYYAGERWRHYFRDKAYAADYDWLQGKLPSREIFPTGTLDDQTWLVNAFSDTEPGETYVFDRRRRELTFQYRIRENLPRAALVEMKAVHYQSTDGLDIPAYLMVPKGVPANNLPALMLPHGGPWGRDNWGYNGLAQFLANRGYAVLMANFRGSTGYGKKFLDAGNHEWGRMMQADLTAGVKFLEAEGIADPKRIGIIGGSYGGYATLAGVAFTPEVYSAAVDIVGPSNLVTLLNSIPPYWESVRKLLYARVGDPGTPEGRKLLAECSPLSAVQAIRTPLLVVQGANDPRVNRREAEQIVVALRDRNFSVGYLLAPDEGHGFARPVNNMALYMAAEKFFADHLGGRYQAGGTPEVIARLAEITVDPRTVVLAPQSEVTPSPAAKP